MRVLTETQSLNIQSWVRGIQAGSIGVNGPVSLSQQAASTGVNSRELSESHQRNLGELRCFVVPFISLFSMTNSLRLPTSQLFLKVCESGQKHLFKATILSCLFNDVKNTSTSFKLSMQSFIFTKTFFPCLGFSYGWLIWPCKPDLQLRKEY